MDSLLLAIDFSLQRWIVAKFSVLLTNNVMIMIRFICLSILVGYMVQLIASFPFNISVPHL